MDMEVSTFQMVEQLLWERNMLHSLVVPGVNVYLLFHFTITESAQGTEKTKTCWNLTSGFMFSWEQEIPNVHFEGEKLKKDNGTTHTCWEHKSSLFILLIIRINIFHVRFSLSCMMQLWRKQKDSSFIQYKTFKMQLSWIVVSKYCTSAIWEYLNIGFKVWIKANLRLLTYFLTTFSANSSSRGYLSVLFLQDSGIPWRPVWKHIKVTTESITGTFTIPNHCQAHQTHLPRKATLCKMIYFLLACCVWVCVCASFSYLGFNQQTHLLPINLLLLLAPCFMLCFHCLLTCLPLQLTISSACFPASSGHPASLSAQSLCLLPCLPSHASSLLVSLSTLPLYPTTTTHFPSTFSSHVQLTKFLSFILFNVWWCFYWLPSTINDWFTCLVYLCSETGPYEGGSAGGASPAAHGVPDCFIQLVQRQDAVKRSLECTWQSWTQTQGQ